MTTNYDLRGGLRLKVTTITLKKVYICIIYTNISFANIYFVLIGTCLTSIPLTINLCEK